MSCCRRGMSSRKFKPPRNSQREPVSFALVGVIRWLKIANLRFYWVFEGFLRENRQKLIIFDENK
jgi:hypothetical protein